MARNGFLEATLDEHRAAIHPKIRALNPFGWRELLATSVGVVFGGRCWDSPDGIRAIISAEEINGAQWLHLSASRRSRTPSYEELLRVRRVFLDEALPAYQVLPRMEEYRSLRGSTVLHLWQPLGADPFPDPLLERANTVAPGWDHG